MRDRTLVVVAVPFHNEARHLPDAIACLRAQQAPDIPVVFVDNGSTDASGDIVRECPEVIAGDWACLREPRIGKYRAMARATAWSKDRFDARYVAFLDADSTCDTNWLQAIAPSLAASPSPAGYVYSPYSYVGFDHLPVFGEAYRAVDMAIHFLVEHVGWFGNSAGGAFAVDVLSEFLDRAQATPEQGLRCSLLALARGRAGALNPAHVFTSARRFVASEENFQAWCFYDRAFYLNKDINRADKIALGPQPRARDLDPHDIPRFYQRQAVKITCRNLIPLAMCDRNARILGQLAQVFGAHIVDDTLTRLDGVRWHADVVTSDEFESRLGFIERHCAGSALVRSVVHLIHASARVPLNMA
jgi:glycosyltransferase involved in cell wall biosynthesis